MLKTKIANPTETQPVIGKSKSVPPALLIAGGVLLAPVVELKAAAVHQTMELLKQGKKGLLACTSQAAAETIDITLTTQGYKVDRFDAITCSGNDGMGKYVDDIDGYLGRTDAQLVIYTPTLEAGVSIEGDWAEFVIGLGYCNEPAQLHQMLNRVRTDVPRYIFAATISTADFGRMNAKTALKRWIQQSADAYADLGVIGDEKDYHAIQRKFTAEIEAMQAIGCIRYHDRLVDLILQDGHEVTSAVYPVHARWITQALRDSKTQMVENRVIEWMTLNDLAMSITEAQTIRQSGEATHIERMTAFKRLIREELMTSNQGYLVDDESVVREMWVGVYESKRNWHDCQIAPLLKDLTMAKKRMKQCNQIELDITG